jgi:hypothetical protein
MKKLATIALLACAFPALAQKKADDRVLIYVDDVQPADKSLAADATALTTSLCAALSKDKRLDVMCAPDVKQILNFAATASMIGTQGGAGGAVTDRLDRTNQVVSATLRKEGGQFVLTMKIGPKAADAQATALYSDKPALALEERADQQKKILDKLSASAAKMSESIFKTSASAAVSSSPPAPMEEKKKSGGW